MLRSKIFRRFWEKPASQSHANPQLPLNPKAVSGETGFLSLQLIHEKSIDILRLERLEDICPAATKHFVESFQFDYAVISLIDFNERRISSQYTYAAFPMAEKMHPDNWKQLSDYPIDIEDTPTDILIWVMQLARPVVVLGDRILDENIPTSAFNREIFEQYGHEKLSRLYLPIIHRGQKKDKAEDREPSTPVQRLKEGDFILGVLECGFIQMETGKRCLAGDNAASGTLQLQFYLDNFAQSYFTALRRIVKRKARRWVKTHEDIEKPDDFVKAVVDQTVHSLKADWGFIAFASFNTSNINFEKAVQYGYEVMPPNPSDGTFSITRHVIETQKPYLTGDVKQDKFYLEVHPDIASEMAVPIVSEETLLGVMVISSRKKHFFNIVHLYEVEQMADRLASTYLKKKRLYAVQGFSPSQTIFSESRDDIYRYIVRVIEQYFDSDYVAVWERVEKGRKMFHLNQTTSPKLYSFFVEQRLTEKNIKLEAAGRPQFYVQPVSGLKPSSGIYKFCIQHKFRTYVVITVDIEGDYKVFFNVFSKREIPVKLSLEDSIFLYQIVRRTRNAIQSSALVESFNEISESLTTKGRNETLQAIVRSALNVLHADLVVLFPYENRTIRVGDAVFAGVFPKQHSIEKDKPANAANIIIKEGTQWLSSASDYFRLLEKSSGIVLTEEEKKQTFWVGNDIKAVAAIRLEFQGRVLGVMFFNYALSTPTFDDPDNRKFIQAFARYAIAVFLNANFLHKIEAELAQLQRETAELSQQKLALEFKYEETHKKMEEMVPMATRTSFYEILDSINHDVRNTLLNLETATFDLLKHVGGMREKDRKQIERSNENINSNIRYISNLLTLFDFKKAGKEVVDINQLIKSVIAFFRFRHYNLEFDTKGLNRGIPDILCYKAELSMIIYNLTMNAVTAVEQRGESYKGIIRFCTDKQDGHILFSIEDNGVGIDNKNKGRIYEPGFSTKENGIGIGLYFVRETLKSSFFVEDILLESTVNVGTKFTILIPEYINWID